MTMRDDEKAVITSIAYLKQHSKYAVLKYLEDKVSFEERLALLQADWIRTLRGLGFIENDTQN